jgi:hypoxanthine phosphoribosyltransferase
MKPKYLPISEQEMAQAVMAIACKIEDEFKGSSIITFSNSGVHACSLIIRELSYKPTILAIDPAEFMARNALLLALSRDEKIVVIDDILDSGSTMKKFCGLWGGFDHHFFLVDKQGDHRVFTPERMTAPLIKKTSDYIVFPWEDEYDVSGA